MKLSVVTTLFGSERYVAEFYERISVSAQRITDSYELVFVDDGSPDQSLQKVVEISRIDSKVKVIELSKNHGHHRAMMVGLAEASGENTFLIDCDLEESPENLTLFWDEQEREQDVDVIKGLNVEVRVGIKRSFFSKAFYSLFNSFSSVKIDENELVSRLMNRKYVDALLRYQESDIFIPGIWEDAGFKVKKVPTQKSFDGYTTYSLRKRLLMAVNALTSFSNKPLIYIFYLGLGSSAVSFLFMISLLLKKFLWGVGVDGWTSIMGSIYLMGSVILFSLGVIGIYLSRVFTEIKDRPRVIIRNRFINGKIYEKHK